MRRRLVLVTVRMVPVPSLLTPHRFHVAEDRDWRGTADAVDAAHGEVRRQGLRVVYPLRDESWGVHRFFAEDPGGTIVNVLAHVR